MAEDQESNVGDSPRSVTTPPHKLAEREAAEAEARAERNRIRQSRRPSLSGALLHAMMPETFEDEDDDKERVGDGTVFLDAEAMKEKVRKNLLKETYDVSKYYKTTGVWRTIATSPQLFEKITLCVIAFNAVWIGVDTDWNDADILLDASPAFQIAEHSFCLFFSFEWFSRFMSFADKRNGLRDAWFVFDSSLVFMMVMETWMLTVVMLLSGAGGGGGLGNASILRMARLARLSRMARMARLLKAMPELLILIKGIAAATRSVFFTLCLLGILLYIFAIAFTQLTVGTEVRLFESVPASMYTLLVCGTLMDNIAVPLNKLAELSFAYAALYLLFVLLATITVMNMLIGVLCEVVSAVAAVENETLTVTFVKNKLQCVLNKLDEDGSGTISKEEFKKVLESREAVEALHDVGVDVEGITEFADFLFADEEDTSRSKDLSFPDFMNIILQFRGTNNATVKDIVEFHKFVKLKLEQTTSELRELRALVPSLKEMLLRESQQQHMAQPAALATMKAGHKSVDEFATFAASPQVSDALGTEDEASSRSKAVCEEAGVQPSDEWKLQQPCAPPEVQQIPQPSDWLTRPHFKTCNLEHAPRVLAEETREQPPVPGFVLRPHNANGHAMTPLRAPVA
eukprot:CAMPEP_0115439764 /NCGR_PEP_ID=MMETSP0271-20121206/35944_1 /TAXON_ID=71861 /ORGANISM="Scrippsiella trochoidea, Strain CCMP3099" /LENGTH=628 /DNA_ID=CAMNT_0002865465 /DNA_START=73 /DNA_END=1956 /DNA_ORIENTATION=+